MRSLSAVVLLPLVASLLHAQSPVLKILFENQPARGATLGSMQQRGTLYVSLNDVARLCSLKVQDDRTTRVLALSLNTREARFFADNPFVVITGPTGQKSTYQLAVNVIFSQNDYYAPVASCPPIFEHVLGTSVTYHPQTHTLRIGRSAFQRPTFDITTLVLEPKANGLLIRVPVARALKDYESLLKQDGWLYVTIPGATADVAALNKVKPTGLVKRILAIQSATSLQLTFKLEGRIASSEIVRDPASNDLLITIHETPAERPSSSEERKQPNSHIGLESHRKKYELDVIVLDAGHGGKDPGTIGVTGVKEKDVALGIVLKLGKLIEKNLKDVKVVYTRKTDTFVELDRRGQIANQANGKLFISVHCNAMPRKPSPRRGFEVYLLRPGRTDEAIAIAERENSVIELEEGFEQRYQKLTDENFILVTMAQSAHMKASERFAELVTRELDRHLTTPNNGVLQAGFLVLVGASMPNVLIETAYLSNREDERFLNSQAGQQQYAEAIFKAIKLYKEEYDKLLQEGRAFGTK
jgi:N-acetylmuramoyl-L-alanine amidase